MTVTELIVEIRDKLLEGTPSFYTDARLVAHINAAIADLWRAIADNFQDYFFAVDETVTLAAGAYVLGNVPSNLAKIGGIEPVSLSSYGSLKFRPADYNSAQFQNARATDAVEVGSGGIVYYAATGAGGPVGAPIIYIAPALSAALAIRLIYTPTTPKVSVAGNEANPIPGESDNAIINFAVAHALAREREDRKPDPDWLALYATEKANVLTFLTPRQNDEPDVAEGVHDVFNDG
jgi:hypothetical protein